MEASALPAQVGLTRTRIAIGAPLLRLRSDEQLVSLFRTGDDEAFRAIHDRYRPRLHAYTRQMLAGTAVDAEDAVQEIFVRAYAGLRAGERHLALRAWLYRVAHNRCIDELRRPQSVTGERLSDTLPGSLGDPVASLERRDALQRLIIDVGRLPEQQRSALLMRELGGMTYVDVAGALGITVAAVKSLLVRARVSLAQASQARDATCAEVRADLVLAHDRGVRCSGLARRHLRDCEACRSFRGDIRSTSRQLAALVPTLGPLAAIGSMLGLGGAGGASAAAGGGMGASTAASGVATGLTAGAAGGAGHVVTLLAAAVVTAGGAIELQHITPLGSSATGPRHHLVAPRHPVIRRAAPAPAPAAAPQPAPAPAPLAAAAVIPTATARIVATGGSVSTPAKAVRIARRAPHRVPALSLTELMDPDHLVALPGTVGVTGAATSAGAATTAASASTATGGAGVSPGAAGSSTPSSTGSSTAPSASSTPPTSATPTSSTGPASSTSAGSSPATSPDAGTSGTTAGSGGGGASPTSGRTPASGTSSPAGVTGP